MITFFKQFWSIFKRRTLIYFRSFWNISFTILVTVGLSSVSLILYYISKTKLGTQFIYGFIDFPKSNLKIARILSNSCENNICFPEISNYLTNTCKNEIGIIPEILDFNNLSEFHQWSYNQQLPAKHNTNVAFAYLIENSSELIYNGNEVQGKIHIKFLSNSSYFEPAYRIMRRMIWKLINKNENSDYLVSISRVNSANADMIVSLLSPFFISSGLMNICSIFISQSINEINTNKRPYMISAGLSLWSYWFGSFFIDLILIQISSIFIWIAHYFMSITFFYYKQF